jgi:hypothetical protein
MAVLRHVRRIPTCSGRACPQRSRHRGSRVRGEQPGRPCPAHHPARVLASRGRTRGAHHAGNPRSGGLRCRTGHREVLVPLRAERSVPGAVVRRRPAGSRDRCGRQRAHRGTLLSPVLHGHLVRPPDVVGARQASSASYGVRLCGCRFSQALGTRLTTAALAPGRGSPERARLRRTAVDMGWLL